MFSQHSRTASIIRIGTDFPPEIKQSIEKWEVDLVILKGNGLSTRGCLKHEDDGGDSKHL